MSDLLRELGRTTQILLEHHRRDPDCEETWHQLERERAALNAEWLRHTVNVPEGKE